MDGDGKGYWVFCGILFSVYPEQVPTPKSSRIAPSTPSSQLSLVLMDFIKGLPSSVANTVILVVDRFSKAFHFIQLPKFPSALEIAKLV